mmetsp:Transcript_25989/g.82067  ORF Transcript_25989/g.82067 Transcript_25989/m.82067 type:complete len:251 (-) Transcript_25989:2060-2812(-)
MPSPKSSVDATGAAMVAGAASQSSCCLFFACCLLGSCCCLFVSCCLLVSCCLFTSCRRSMSRCCGFLSGSLPKACRIMRFAGSPPKPFMRLCSSMSEAFTTSACSLMPGKSLDVWGAVSGSWNCAETACDSSTSGSPSMGETTCRLAPPPCQPSRKPKRYLSPRTVCFRPACPASNPAWASCTAWKSALSSLWPKTSSLPRRLRIFSVGCSRLSSGPRMRTSRGSSMKGRSTTACQVKRLPLRSRPKSAG